ncbi:MAG: nucleotidyltransferase domain-containing protein [Gammaproteobacteria bacterium]|nr:nucleotidyltransferase domain-containing protein [Gammaproteobacteria bacterium]
MNSNEQAYGLNFETIGRIQASLAGFREISQAALYGSRAKGTYKPGSDIDLTLKTDGIPSSDLLFHDSPTKECGFQRTFVHGKMRLPRLASDLFKTLYS